MDVSLFDFDLPEGRIALRPAIPRDSARMLVIGNGAPLDRTVRDLPDHLRPGDVMVFNNTRVIPSYLIGKKGDARIEANLIEAIDETTWNALTRPAKKLQVGDVVDFDGLKAKVVDKGESGAITFCFETGNMTEALAQNGRMPLPPYIARKRAVDAQDRQDYQTLFAEREGAVAAPTAGLHFTPSLMGKIKSAGASSALLTLHVGAGTFLPVKADNTDDHIMHAEWGEIDADTAKLLNEARTNGGRIIAVGTTCLRLLESATDADGMINPFSGKTNIFITPGYRFRAVDGLLTNFHLPKSTLFMLVSAFSGLDVMMAAYAHAIEADYRFYSYGDACLLLPEAVSA